MTQENKKFITSLTIPVIFIISIWLIKTFELISGIELTGLGIYPREMFGLVGIITFPLIHADINHLMSNTLPILFLGTGIYYFYPDSSKKVIIIIYFLTGLLVWLFARSAFHIGASGIVYGLVTFFFFSGVLRRDKRAISLALIVTFLYGGLVWGILPIKEGMSWESHLFGSLWGIIFAFLFRKNDKYKRYDWEDEEESTPVDELKISYDKEDPF